MTPDEMRKIRISLGMTRQALADAFGIRGKNGASKINAWESGEQTINGITALAMKYLELTMKTI